MHGRRLAAILGLCLYHEPGLHHPDRSFWNSLFTYWLFSPPACSVQLLFMDALRPEGSRKEGGAPGWYRIHRIGLHTQMLLIPLQLLLAQSPFSTYLQWHLTLYSSAIAGPLLLIRNGASRRCFRTPAGLPCRSGSGPGSSSCLSWCEVCGRVLFYSGYTWLACNEKPGMTGAFTRQARMITVAGFVVRCPRGLLFF